MKSVHGEHGRPILVIGNKNYSSWSLRPWLLLRKGGVDFAEERIALDQPDTPDQIARYSGAGRVPVLVDGPLTVWDSLAICEYAIERWPGMPGWPPYPEGRTLARSAVCEMHAGFAALRGELPMNCRSRRRGVVPSPAGTVDIERIQRLWSQCLAYGEDSGPWLFGEFGIVDAMFAPVALRFDTYGVELDETAVAYVATVCSDEAIREWVAAARAETEVLTDEERGEPVAD